MEVQVCKNWCKVYICHGLNNLKTFVVHVWRRQRNQKLELKAVLTGTEVEDLVHLQELPPKFGGRASLME